MNKYVELARILRENLPEGNSSIYLTSDNLDFARIVCFRLVGDQFPSTQAFISRIQEVITENHFGECKIHLISNDAGIVIELV